MFLKSMVGMSSRYWTLLAYNFRTWPTIITISKPCKPRLTIRPNAEAKQECCQDHCLKPSSLRVAYLVLNPWNWAKENNDDTKNSSKPTQKQEHQTTKNLHHGFQQIITYTDIFIFRKNLCVSLCAFFAFCFSDFLGLFGKCDTLLELAWLEELESGQRANWTIKS